MSTRKKQKKPFFSKWRKGANIADGLSTTFFELKLNSAPVQQPDPPKSVQEPVAKERNEVKNDHSKMDAPLHLINVII